MVGFVVTPTTASSFMSFFSEPDSSMCRDSESIQTDWPFALSACRFDLAMCHLSFHRSHFFQPSYVALAAVELRPEKRAHAPDRQTLPEPLGAEAENIYFFDDTAPTEIYPLSLHGGLHTWALASGFAIV